jgi:hypothetical protein
MDVFRPGLDVLKLILEVIHKEASELVDPALNGFSKFGLNWG